MKPDTNKEMKLFNGDSYKNYQQNSASIHCHSMKQKKKKKKKRKKRTIMVCSVHLSLTALHTYM